MSSRIEQLRNKVDSLAEKRCRNDSWSRFCLQHMYAVSSFAAMIAEKRGLDVELALIIGQLHDIYSLLNDDTEKHAKNGSKLARELLTEMGIVDAEELEIICTAIKYHSKKRLIHDEYSELAKDADVLSHYYHDGFRPALEKDRERLEALQLEFDLNDT